MLRAIWAPRHELHPHDPTALKPALRPLLPANAELRVYRLGERALVVGATIGGRRLSLRVPIVPRMNPAPQWAADVAARILAWSPPRTVLAPLLPPGSSTRPPEPEPPTHPPATAASPRSQQLNLFTAAPEPAHG